ncbi:uncharacterized protein SETTUDRAFT_166461 [Exserohilum turcica Et28A]|uniref:Uncharacterized protein n=1 Tax=Exserohilum turcicum (strain 28A) TaxID=671987 RepID=R0JUD8_EXST2|nr:uncharacterized protein SETTUDRAFT_166461 [Exserohilum turcica Et28A]EOA81114.1 hypothetical protein SETTUDRAFT_166461 [Exserohilum turcica Et28A]
MEAGKCTKCDGRCAWQQHKNVHFYVEFEYDLKLVVPEEMIKCWNTNNNTLEGALLDSIADYLKSQEELREDILYLAHLTEKLKESALLHDPSAIIKYIEGLVKTARQYGAMAEHLLQLTTAQNTLLLVLKVKEMGCEAVSDSEALLQILRAVREEMSRRMALAPQERAEEEERPCSLYNDLRSKLPPRIRKNVLPKLESGSKLERVRKLNMYAEGARYPQNLKAIIKPIKAVLEDGGIVSAIATARSH